MNDRRDRTRATYDEIARQFLENTRDRSMMRRWLERFAAHLGPDARVLDVGCGPGLDSSELTRLGLRPISLDLSMGMLRAGLREFSALRVLADARHLPVKSDSMRGVWANASLLHLTREEAATALREAHRVLADRGLLHVSVKAGSGAGWRSERYGRPRWFQFWSDSELDDLLQGAHFDVVASWTDSTPRTEWLIRHCMPAG